ncbi:hypothetical protein RRSWK_04359 [Rhodopirellula sp. SWK7]|nr:hypothetical protein RRSWK_04359 [Rhodopirellula sp. SWK7]
MNESPRVRRQQSANANDSQPVPSHAEDAQRLPGSPTDAQPTLDGNQRNVPAQTSRCG